VAGYDGFAMFAEESEVRIRKCRAGNLSEGLSARHQVAFARGAEADRDRPMSPPKTKAGRARKPASCRRADS